MDILGQLSNQRHGWIALAMLLSLLALVPRLYDLGERSFYGDEETTAMPSLAAASGQGSVMPSGMPYYRGLPHTYLNAIVLQFADQDSEASYRIISALLGAATIAIFFLGVRSFFGLPVALLSSSLLLLSDWHIMVSREGRMYAPFLFAYLLAAWSTLNWVRSGRRTWLASALVSFALTVALHALGLFVLMFALIPAALSIRQRVSLKTCVVFFASLAVLGFLYGRWFVAPAYTGWGVDGQIAMLPRVEKESGSLLSNTFPMVGQAWSAIIVVGVVLGSCIGARLLKIVHHSNYVATAAIIVLSVCGAILAVGGQLYGAACFAVGLFFVVPERTAWVDRGVLFPAAVAAVIAIGWGVYACLELGIIDGIKALLKFPFPYLPVIGLEMPGVMGLFVIGIIAAAVGDRTKRAAYGVAILAVLGPMLAIGVLSEWGGKRYLIHTYPFILIIAAFGVLSLMRFLLGSIREDWQRFALPIALLWVIAGIDAGHGARAAFEATRANYTQFPDHRSAGQFVRMRMREDDIIVAEDVLQQKWYVGRVDYWLRNPATHAGYLYYDEHGAVRDIYVASRVCSAAVIAGLEAQKERVWVITSGETAAKPKYNLDDAQRRWLHRLQQSGPVYVGRDGVTAVYCLNCQNDNT